MWYIVAFYILFIVGVFDGHTSSFAALLLLYILGFWSVNTMKNQVERTNGSKVFGIVFSVYTISAFIASRSFLDGQYFYVSDSMKYIEMFYNLNNWSWSNTFFILTDTYFNFADNNGLFNVGIALWAYIANHFLDGTSVFHLTLFQTLFGVLASIEIYKIYTLYFEPKKAVKYTCVFALLSLFHLYSIVIIRDIVIAYFYMLGLRMIMGKPKVSDIYILLLVMIITTGVRLYTGLFFGVFIMFWLYKLVKDKKYASYRIVFVPIIIVGVMFVGAAFASSVLVESAAGEIESYNTKYSELSGAVAQLRKLPIGVRHVAILFFSQLPFDSFRSLSLSNSFSNYYLSILAIVYKIFGFVVFYGLMYYCFIKGFFKKMSFNDKWVMIIMLIFIAITLSTHIDVRRCMEAYPIFALLFIQLLDKYCLEKKKIVIATLVVISLLIMFTYALRV